MQAPATFLSSPNLSLYLARLCLLVCAYVITGRLGLAIPYIGSSITLLWLPTGISVAALLRWGPQYWPGIALGAFLVNFSIDGSFLLAFGICIGNTLGPVLAAWMLSRGEFNHGFDQQRDFFLFMLAAVLGMQVPASLGVACLYLAGLLPGNILSNAWFSWWLGDTVGVLLIAPLLLSLTWARWQEMMQRKGELLIWALLLGVVCWAVFFFNRAEAGRSYPLAFLPFPLLVWTTLRFNVGGASLAVLILSVVAAVGTATGHGPFIQPDPQQGLLLLWAYVVTLFLVGMIINVLQADRRAMLQLLVEKEQLLRTIVDTEPECVKVISAEGRMLQMNQAGLEMLEADSIAEVSGQVIAGMVLPQYREAFDALTQRVFAGESGVMELEMRALKGTQRWVETHAVPMRDASNQVFALLAITRDISKRKLAEAQVQRLAFYDPLTNLPNRRLLVDRVAHAQTACRRSHAHAALLFMDIDHFKRLNDTLGHAVGDQMLIDVARRLQMLLREGDTVARLGGDEFVILLENLDADARGAALEAESVAEKICERLCQPYHLHGQERYSTLSMGISLFSDQSESVDELLKRADMAMYQAKNAGRNAIRFFDPAMQHDLETRTALEADLRRALQDGQLGLHYQGQVDQARRIVGAEALLRWQHPQRGAVSPAQFIPLAEESGLILPIGRWVLEMACTQLKRWEGAANTRNLMLAVNVSARQFRQPDFVAEVESVVRQSGCNPALLKLELTESMLLDNVDQAIEKMTALKALGLQFSMDDFGTGYSSLSYLKRLPIDQLKIDQSFVRDISTDPDDEAIVKAIIGIADVLGMSVIAEGVENEAQREFLQRHGCPVFQGYLFGRPLPLADFEASLALAAAA